MKKINIKKIALVLTLALGLTGIAACGNSGSDSKTSQAAVQSASNTTSETSTAAESGESIAHPSEINVASFIVTHLNIEKLADKLGYFDEEFADLGVKVNIVEFGTGGQVNEAFASGSVDFAFYGDQPTINGIANSVPVTILGSPMRTEKANAILVRVDSEITSVEQLAGKKVGTTIGTAQHKILLQILDKHGLTADDVELNNLKNSDLITALIAGELDAVLSLEPTVTTYVKSGDVRILEDGTGFVNTSVFVGRTDFINSYPEVTERYIRALLRAEQYRNEHTEEAAQIIADIVDTDPSYILEYWPKYNMELRASEDDIESLKKTLEFLRSQGSVDHDISFEGTYDFSFVEKAYASYNAEK